MSGGSLDYLYFKIEEASRRIRAEGTPLYVAFADHLALVADALHDVEWVLSGDYHPEQAKDAIRAVLHPHAELQAARALAERALADLTNAIKEADRE